MSGDWARLVWDLFFPRTCTVCGRTLNLKEKHFCLNCYAGFPLTYFWELKDHPAEEVFWGRTPFRRVYALFYYVNDYRKPLHRLKYKADIQIGLYLGERLGRKISTDPHQSPGSINYIVPVPLHFRKKWKRGYNQSEIIAKGILKGITGTMFPISAGYRIPISDPGQKPGQDQHRQTHPASNSGIPPQLLPNLLQRKQFTKTQTQKTRIERWHNVSDAFRINPRAMKKLLCQTADPAAGPCPACPLHILLVDDVLTTGATLDACAQLLQKHLNCTVSIATLAYVE